MGLGTHAAADSDGTFSRQQFISGVLWKLSVALSPATLD
jgi:hypothetical protein